MSALFVRDMVRTWCAALPTPFHDTINREQDPSDPVWMTVEFISLEYQGETFCGPGWLERGQVILTWLAEPGIGDDALLAVMEPDVRAFMANTDPQLKLGQLTPVFERSGGDADRWYQLGVEIRYDYNTN